jgi:pyruvate dehydrogenase E2 component (dihydrolipoamide acetyltransferase)
VRADVLAFEKSGASAPTPGATGAPAAGRQAAAGGSSGPVFAPASPGKPDVPQADKLIPLSNMRAVIARRTQESKVQAPHIYLEVEIDASPLLGLRAQLNSALEKEGVKLSVNDFILKACASALRRVPAVNASWEGDAAGGQGSIRQHGSVNVSFAVSIEEGLITPVIRDTASKTIFAISAEAKTLAKLARDKKLQPAQFTGGTFCVSNMGMLGIDRFGAIINQPNAAILAVGGTVKKPVVVDDEIVIGQRMSLTLSCDHRVLDGAIGAAYLSALREFLEKPALLLI